MIHLAIIFHMHQPYYKDLVTREVVLPWVRLHGTKDYLDMVTMLEKFPKMRLTFNMVPSLLEQVEDYATGSVKDKFLELSLKPAKELSVHDKKFILENFFSINKDKVIALFPRYYELYFKKQRNKELSDQDYLDLQIWFNLAWMDPDFRKNIPEVKNLIAKGRFFREEDKGLVLSCYKDILKQVIPAYKKFMSAGQVELSVSPYYHAILPLLCDTESAKLVNPKAQAPKAGFSYPQDAEAQISEAVNYFKEKFGCAPRGMWPSEQAVSENILPLVIGSGIDWIVVDEAVLFKSLGKKERDTALLYQPYRLEREEGAVNIVFRDRNLSDLIGFTYQAWSAKRAVDDFLAHLDNIALAFDGRDILVTVAMDGENAWEYFDNDGHDFLELLYQKLSDANNVTTTTVQAYLKKFPPKNNIAQLASGSWIFGEFTKWIGSPAKNRAWEWLVEARKELEGPKALGPKVDLKLAWKQMHVLEGSDWFWWAGEDPTQEFDRLYRLHLKNFYTILGKKAPGYLERPLIAQV